MLYEKPDIAKEAILCFCNALNECGSTHIIELTNIGVYERFIKLLAVIYDEKLILMILEAIHTFLKFGDDNTLSDDIINPYITNLSEIRGQNILE